ncbi:MAG: STAS domain-containing protein [Phycisphaerales bacterium]|nr:STAS domain-containing protein [Phycisphaerales bacterium]
MFSVTSTLEPEIGGVVLKLSGSAVSDANEQIHRYLAFVNALHPRAVILDLSAMDIIVSRNIGELITFRRAIHAGPPGNTEPPPYGRVVIAAASPMIQKALVFTRLTELFTLYSDVPAAVEALRPQPTNTVRAGA